MNAATRFIIIDDDVLNNRICTVSLEKIFSDADIRTFIDPVEGYNHLIAECDNLDAETRIVVFLDIAMPALNGWEFLEQFDKMSEDIKKHVRIYVLSSSDNVMDIEKATANKNVVSYLVKPFTKKTIRLISLSLGKTVIDV